MRICELRIKDEQDRRAVAAVMVANGYRVSLKTVKVGEGVRARTSIMMVVETAEEVKA